MVKGYNNDEQAYNYVEDYFNSIIFKDPQVERIAYDNWRAEQLQGKWGGQCVIFIRLFADLTPTEFSGTARDIPTNATQPSVGGLVKTSESENGHWAYILGSNERAIFVIGSNYNLNERVNTRWIDRENEVIIGYSDINKLERGESN